MATIKLQPSGKVVLKDGKVACTCCEELENCLYNAQALVDGIYSANDLPDTFTVFGGFEQPEILAFVKDGAGYISGEVRIEAIFVPRFQGTPGRYVWKFVDGARINWKPDCLISGDPSEGNYSLDDFANTYTISGPISGIVTRDGLGDNNTDISVWRGNTLTLRYNGKKDFVTPVGSFKWQVNGNNKIGFQNTPVGSYAGGFTVS
jgi:hypothetical protein